MPSKSSAQHNLMEGIAHGMKPSSGKGPSVAVARDFVAADRGKRFAKVQGMSQSSEGGHRGRHSTQMHGHATHGAYSIGKRGAGK